MRKFFQVIFTIILSFSALLVSNPIYATDWTSETDVPDNPTFIGLSNIFVSSGNFVTYISTANSTGTQHLWLYNLSSGTYTQKSDVPALTYDSPLSPNPLNNMFVTYKANEDVLRFYDPDIDTWSTSSSAPTLSTGHASAINAVVWSSSDLATIWVWARDAVDPSDGKILKYDFGGDNWTEYVNVFSATSSETNINGITINTDETAIYMVSNTNNYGIKYVIATDTYSTIGGSWANLNGAKTSDPFARFWMKSTTVMNSAITRYNADNETITSNAFPANSNRDRGSNNFGLSESGNLIIAHQTNANPKLWTNGDFSAVPVVLSWPNTDTILGVSLWGYYESEATVTSAGFDFGTESGVYTINIDAVAINEIFRGDIPTANLTVGQTYYWRAKASSVEGTGYGEELSFTWNGGSLHVTVDNIITQKKANGNYTATFRAWYFPLVSSNLTGYLDDNIDFSSPETLYALSSSPQEIIYSTANLTNPDNGTLTENTTYYVKANIVYAGQSWESNIISFVATDMQDLPKVTMISVTEQSNISSGYVFILKGQITSNISANDTVIDNGFEFSLDSANGMLLSPIYGGSIGNQFLLDRKTFETILSLQGDTWSWYNGEKLYFICYIVTANYGKIYSLPFSYDPDALFPTSTSDSGITDISDTVKQTRESLGMIGTFGTWAFMFLILLIVSLLFGIGFYVTQNPIGKTAIGFAWLMSSVSVVGAFLFTGQLGIWPLVVLVFGVVALIIIVISFRFSGNRGIE